MAAAGSGYNRETELYDLAKKMLVSGTASLVVKELIFLLFLSFIFSGFNRDLLPSRH